MEAADMTVEPFYVNKKMGISKNSNNISSRRSYNFDELCVMFEKITNKKYKDDDSITKQSITNNSNNNKYTEDKQEKDLMGSSSKIIPNENDLDSTNRPSNTISNHTQKIVDNNSINIQHSDISSSLVTSKNEGNNQKLKKSIKLKIFKNGIQNQQDCDIETVQSCYTPREERKIIIRQKLQHCLHRLNPPIDDNNSNNVTKDSKNKNNLKHIFSLSNQTIHNVCGIDFIVYQQNQIDSSNKKKKIIVTLHDIVNTPQSNFERLFSNQFILDAIQDDTIVFHICLPGQSIDSNTLIKCYPRFTELSRMFTVLLADNLKVESCIGIGVGAGADLLLRSSLLVPILYSHLILINLKFRTVDKFKLIKYPLIFNPFSSLLTQYGKEYFESNCIKSFCASTVNMKPLMRYKHFLKHIKTNPNISQLALQYWKRSDLDYYIDEVFRRLESIPKILIKPNVLLVEGLINPSTNTRGDILDFVFPGKRVYRCFENGSKLVLDEYTEQIANLIVNFLKNKLY